MMRALTAITAFVALAGATLPAFACMEHETTAQTSTPQTVVDSGATPMTPIPTATPKTGG
jgi:ABC-type oligopeptide transport system substrate-binding subunit